MASPKKIDFLLNAVLMLISVFIALVLAEGALRIYYHGSIFFKPDAAEDKFWQFSPDLGWEPVPGAAGDFSNSHKGYDAHVTFDQQGLRSNGNGLENQPVSILLVGDSTTAGLEVDDNETFGAILERKLNADGCKVSIYNAGVRGYGTDQSYWRMQKYLETHRPNHVVYMFTENDLINNRTIKRANRLYSKPVFVLDNGELKIRNHPVRQFEKSYFSFVTYDENGFEIHTGQVEQDTIDNSDWKMIKDYFKENLALYHPIKQLYLASTTGNDPNGNGNDKNPGTKHGNGDTQPEKKPENAKFTNWQTDNEILELLIGRMKKESGSVTLTSFTKGETTHREQLQHIAAKLDIPYVDLSGQFTEKMQTYHWRDDGHWNEKGHAQAAAGLYSHLKSVVCE